MKRFWNAVKSFFSPPPDSNMINRLAPFIAVAFLMIVLFVFSMTAWEYTNETQFCGLTCHTMPPEFQTHELSAHANVSCEDCHMGRDTMNVLIPRKIMYSWQTGTAMITGSYHYPIFAKNMRPARDACENCHNPDKFSSDTMIEVKQFADGIDNALTTTYMLLKTGGGTEREGLGFGIHWHVENPVYYYATDELQQNIPYIKVTKADGSTAEYVDLEANFDPSSIKQEDLIVMDCITCHNRTAHDILSPSDEMDKLMGRGVISPSIPEIHERGKDFLATAYDSEEQAFVAVEALGPFYQQFYPDFAKANQALIDKAITALKDAYHNSVFLDQKIDWSTHPDNMQHKDFAGCFRCHDGKHISPDGKDTVRLECNLCHSIPTVSTTSQLVSEIPVAKGFEPENHKSPNWINLHRSVFDKSCSACHTIEDPGGTSNTSFCSNSVCHGADWKFVGFDAPKVRELMQSQIPTPTPTLPPTPTLAATSTQQGAQATPTPGSSGGVTYAEIGPIFEAKCSKCHGQTGIKGLSLTSYAKVMAGSVDGPVVVAGNPDDSLLVKVQVPGNHPGQFAPDELNLVKQWISGGALEK